MIYTLHFGDILVGKFRAVEGLAGELLSMHDQRGPFLSFADGQLWEPLRQWVLEGTRWRADSHDNGELRLESESTGSLGVLHTGPLEPMVVFGLQPTGDVREIVFRAANFDPIPQYAQGVWEDWSIQPPTSLERWVNMTTAHRRALLFVTRLVASNRVAPVRTLSDFTIDGRTIQDYPSLFLAIGEAIEGPGGYMGADLDALEDRLRDYVLPASGCKLEWTHSAEARTALAGEWRRQAWRAGFDISSDPSLFSAVNSILEERGVTVMMG